MLRFLFSSKTTSTTCTIVCCDIRRLALSGTLFENVLLATCELIGVCLYMESLGFTIPDELLGRMISS